ncbi:hypothetical protein EYC59_05445 [Candidatus Saccharibacteria bacterium]|nr:MAG: hypothetical protein EYC59_05445 [Candidatus Saccharibacteria bacterium]
MKKPKKQPKPNLDGAFILKMVLYVILGSLWIKIGTEGTGLHIPLPIGLGIGLLFASHEHFRTDRKIDYAVLVTAALFGYLAPYGLYISL